MKRIKLFFWVILFQIFILNNINFNEYLNPYYYLIFLLTIPYKTNKSLALLISFITGLMIDVFSNTYGAHAFASVLITYLKILWENRVHNLQDMEERTELLSLSTEKFAFKIIILVAIHHFTLFYLESFSFLAIWSTLKITATTTIFTTALLIIHKLLSHRKI